MTIKDTIIENSIKLLYDNPNGLRFSELVKEIEKLGIKKNTIPGNLVKLHLYTDKIYKPSKGLFKHIKFKDVDEPIADTKGANFGAFLRGRYASRSTRKLVTAQKPAARKNIVINEIAP